MKETDKFVFFCAASEHMSNFHPAKFIADDHEFSCAAQYIMYRKAVLFDDRATGQALLGATIPADIKSLGHQVTNFNNDAWFEAREQIAYDAVYLKYSQNPDLCAQLLSTGDKHLVEANAEDKLWGVGLAETDDRIEDPTKWLGQNILGSALMQARCALRKQSTEDVKFD
jgi:ribA/ribD-fused uncharacterized protein